MREIRFRTATEFSVTTTTIRHSNLRTTARLDFTFAAGSLRLTFNDPRALLVVVNALDQLAFDVEDPDLTRGMIMTRVFSREYLDGAPSPATNSRDTAELFPFPTARDF